jgi:hypothetical protein
MQRQCVASLSHQGGHGQIWLPSPWLQHDDCEGGMGALCATSAFISGAPSLSDASFLIERDPFATGEKPMSRMIISNHAVKIMLLRVLYIVISLFMRSLVSSRYKLLGGFGMV